MFMSRLSIPHRWRYPLATLGALALLAGAWRAVQPPHVTRTSSAVLCTVAHPRPGGGGIESFRCVRTAGERVSVGLQVAGTLQEIFMPSVGGRTLIVLSLTPPSAPGCSYTGPSVIVRVPGAVRATQRRPLLDTGYQGATLTVPTALARRVVPLAVVASPLQQQHTQCDYANGYDQPPARPASTFE